MLRFLNFKLKIFLGFFGLLAALCLIGLIGYRALTASSGGFAQYRRLADAGNLLGKVQADMLMVRLGVKNFIISGDMADHDEMAAHFAEVAALLQQARAAIVDPGQHRLLDQAEANLQAYDQAFDRVVADTSERGRIVNQVLDVKGPEMEQGLTGILESAKREGDADSAAHAELALRGLLLARLRAAQFLSTNDPATAEQVIAQFAAMADDLALLNSGLRNPLSRNALAAVNQARDLYVESFDQLTAAVFERNEIVDATLDRLGPEFAATIEDLKLAFVAEQDELGPRLTAANISAVAQISWGGAVAAIAALIASLLIVASVTKSVRRAAAYAGAIAQGDFSRTLAIDERGDMGRMAQAMRSIPETLGEVSREFDSLVKAVSLGRLTHRGDPAGFQGAFARIIQGGNTVADKFQGFLDNTPLPMMAIDKDFSVLYLNKAGLEVVGADAKTVRGRKCHDFFKTSDCRTDKCACGRAMRTKAQAESETDAHPAGKDLDIHYLGFPITDEGGAVAGAFEIVIDQTAIRAGQRTMAAAAQRAGDISARLSSAAEELSAQVEQSSRGADIQRSRATETATAMEQMNATVLEVAGNASNAAADADEAKSKARRGSEIVGRVVEAINQVQGLAENLRRTMAGLGEQAESIGQIMNVITDIADQTNLLALNAAIEAARAGEAGRGFAVVADEVRKLAEKTMNATKQVGEAIAAIQEGARKNVAETENAVRVVAQSTDLANDSGRALGEIVELSESTAGRIQAIAAASEEQSAASEQVTRATLEINRISTETSETMSQSAQAVMELASLAQELDSLISSMRA